MIVAWVIFLKCKFEHTEKFPQFKKSLEMQNKHFTKCEMSEVFSLNDD